MEKDAVAEAERECHDAKSTTSRVGCAVSQDPTPVHALADVSVVIWTTTPWTIPGNRALAFGPDITYVVLRVDETGEGATLAPGAKVLVAEALVESFCREAKVEAHHIVYTLPGSALEGAVCAHPLRGAG